MDATPLVLLAVTHIVFDFLLQDRETAKNKSYNLKYLFPHLFWIYIGLGLWGVLFSGYTKGEAFTFALSNTILHGIIDWNIWKVYKYSVLKRFPQVDASFPYQEDSWFYNFIIFDQFLHGVCYLGVHQLIIRGYLS